MGSYPRFCTLSTEQALPLGQALPTGQATVICLIPTYGWRLLTCRVLPGLIVAAATRPKILVGTSFPAHSPCSQSHARLAGRVTTTAGGLLPHRFAPCRCILGAPAGMLSVAVVVRTRLSPACPHLLFHGATLSRSQVGPLDAQDAGQEVGKFLWAAATDKWPATQRRLTHRSIKIIPREGNRIK